MRVEADEELGSYFRVTYDTGEVAEVPWSFVRELPPRKRRGICEDHFAATFLAGRKFSMTQSSVLVPPAVNAI